MHVCTSRVMWPSNLLALQRRVVQCIALRRLSSSMALRERKPNPSRPSTTPTLSVQCHSCAPSGPPRLSLSIIRDACGPKRVFVVSSPFSIVSPLCQCILVCRTRCHEQGPWPGIRSKPQLLCVPISFGGGGGAPFSRQHPSRGDVFVTVRFRACCTS